MMGTTRPRRWPVGGPGSGAPHCAGEPRRAHIISMTGRLVQCRRSASAGTMAVSRHSPDVKAGQPIPEKSAGLAADCGRGHTPKTYPSFERDYVALSQDNVVPTTEKGLSPESLPPRNVHGHHHGRIGCQVYR